MVNQQNQGHLTFPFPNDMPNIMTLSTIYTPLRENFLFNSLIELIAIVPRTKVNMMSIIHGFNASILLILHLHRLLQLLKIVFYIAYCMLFNCLDCSYFSVAFWMFSCFFVDSHAKRHLQIYIACKLKRYTTYINFDKEYMSNDGET